MTQTLSYQIGAVFFLAALMILGTMTRGLFPVGMFKNVTLTLGIVTVIVGGYAAYRALPDMSSWFHFGSEEARTQAAPVATPAPVPKATVKRPVAPAAVAPVGEGPRPVIREVETPAEPVAEPSPVVVRNPATEPDQEGNGKKVIKSVGRFLHIVKKKDDATDGQQTP